MKIHPTQADLTFYLNVHHDLDLLPKCLSQLRTIYPQSRVIIRSDVPRSTLESLLPSLDELDLLTHVRQGLDESGTPLGNEQATVMGKRLPVQGGISIVHAHRVDSFLPSR